MPVIVSSFAADFRAAFDVLLTPRATFRRFGSRNPIVAPWLTFSVLSIVLTLLTLSVMQRASAHLLAGSEAEELRAATEASLARMKLASTVGAPVAVLMRWCFVALALWAPAALAGSTATYRTFLSVAAYSTMPDILEKALDLGVTWFSGPEVSNELVPQLTASTSIAALLPDVSGNEWVVAALANTTLFSLWGLVLWTVGVRVRGRLDRAPAIAVAGSAWCFFLVVGSASDVLQASLAGALG